MKKEFYFVIPIFLMMYLIYSIWIETKDNLVEKSQIEWEKNKWEQIRDLNSKLRNKLTYLDTKARADKQAKESLSYISTWEKVIYLTDEESINKYVKKEQNVTQTIKREAKIYDNMTNYEKWIYIITNKI